MNDYLGNLIGKSFGQVGVVKPRHAPLFAPSPYLTGALAQAAAITPGADGSLLPSRRAWGATEAQPDSAASDAQELPDRGQWLPVSTDAITAFGTADAPFTSPSGLQAAPISAGTPISPSEEPEPSASDLSPAPRVRTRRRSDSAGPDQTPPQPGQVFSQDHASSQSQHQNIAPRSEGDDFDPSENRKPTVSSRLSRPNTIWRTNLSHRIGACGVQTTRVQPHRCRRPRAYNLWLRSRDALSIRTKQRVFVLHRKGARWAGRLHSRQACQDLSRSIGNLSPSKTSEGKLRRNRISLSGQAR